jgi:serine/threonine protein kinase
MSLPCPPPDLLFRLVRGDLTTKALDGVEAHVEECSTCRERLDNLARFTTSQAHPFPSWGSARPPELGGFELHELLGQGGMGIVYRAVQSSLDRTVAIKFLPGGAFGSPSWPQRCLREARAATRVSHPNVVQVYDVGIAEGFPYLVLEYVAGGSLANRLRDGPVTPRTAATLLIAIARAVDHLHRNRIVHRDLKPANILLDGPREAPLADCVPKVADFGLARRLDNADSLDSDGALGTIGFMAPEQFDESTTAPPQAADIHALGAILYCLLTGRQPYMAATAAETLKLIQTQEPVPPRRLHPGIPRDLDTICLKCLDKDPGQRYGSALALAEDLERWLHARPILARRASPPEHLWRFSRRHPAVASLLMTLLLTVTVSIGGLATLLGDSLAARRSAESARDAAQKERERVVTVNELARARDESARVWNMLHTRWLMEDYAHASEERRSVLLKTLLEMDQRFDQQHRQQPFVQASFLCFISSQKQFLGSMLEKAGQIERSRAMRANWLAMIERARQIHPDHDDLRYQHIRALLDNAHLPYRPGSIDEVIRVLAKAASLALACKGDELRLKSLRELSACHLVVAHRLLVSGHRDSAREVLEANLGMLATDAACGAEHPTILFSRAVNLKALGHIQEAKQALQTALRMGLKSDPGGDPPPEQLVELWTSFDFVVYAQVSDDEVLDLGEITQDFVREQRALQMALGLPVERTQSYPYCKMYLHAVATRATGLRAQGRLDMAEHAIAHAMATARGFAEEFPEDPGSFLLLSEMHTQRAKNAMKRQDASAVERETRLALDMAESMVRIDPQSDEARKLLANRAHRLSRLTADPSLDGRPRH